MIKTLTTRYAKDLSRDNLKEEFKKYFLKNIPSKYKEEVYKKSIEAKFYKTNYIILPIDLETYNFNTYMKRPFALQDLINATDVETFHWFKKIVMQLKTENYIYNFKEKLLANLNISIFFNKLAYYGDFDYDMFSILSGAKTLDECRKFKEWLKNIPINENEFDLYASYKQFETEKEQNVINFFKNEIIKTIQTSDEDIPQFNLDLLDNDKEIRKDFIALFNMKIKRNEIKNLDANSTKFIIDTLNKIMDLKIYSIRELYFYPSVSFLLPLLEKCTTMYQNRNVYDFLTGKNILLNRTLEISAKNGIPSDDFINMVIYLCCDKQSFGVYSSEKNSIYIPLLTFNDHISIVHEHVHCISNNNGVVGYNSNKKDLLFNEIVTQYFTKKIFKSLNKDKKYTTVSTCSYDLCIYLMEDLLKRYENIMITDFLGITNNEFLSQVDKPSFLDLCQLINNFYKDDYYLEIINRVSDNVKELQGLSYIEKLEYFTSPIKYAWLISKTYYNPELQLKISQLREHTLKITKLCKQIIKNKTNISLSSQDYEDYLNNEN